MTRVTLLAHTGATVGFYNTGDRVGWAGTSNSAPELLLEFAGRACYQSWDKPNPATAETADYIGHVLDVNHLSVVEHATASFYLEDVSRSFTHELVRHRHLSFSQLSQRFVNLAEETVLPVMPPLCREDDVAKNIVYDAFDTAVDAYIRLETHLRATHPELGTKQVREAARALLPNCTPTSIVVSGNFRSWLEFIDKRDNEHADREIAEVAAQIRDLLKQVAPAVFKPAVTTGSTQLGNTHNPTKGTT